MLVSTCDVRALCAFSELSASALGMLSELITARTRARLLHLEAPRSSAPFRRAAQNP